jgi:hypothetical protein
MVDRLKKLNSHIRFFDVFSDEFSEYGRILPNYDIRDIKDTARRIDNPHATSAYIASVEDFEVLPIAKRLKDEIFGTLDTQIGYCYGCNNLMNAAEWHCSSEVNIAVTPLVLILGKRLDIKNGKLNSADMKAFYVPCGTVLEIYATTLHFCPCQVSEGGFGCIVGLPKGTNTPLEYEVPDKLLFRKNKWIIAHEDNTTLIERGVISGIYGENYKINY